MTEKKTKDNIGNVEKAGFRIDMRLPSGKLALVDSTVLFAVDSEEVKNAIIIPIDGDVKLVCEEKSGARKISIMKDESKKTVEEGMLPAGVKSNDNSLMRRIRKVTSPAQRKRHSKHRETLTKNPLNTPYPKRKRGTSQKHTQKMLANSKSPDTREIIEFIQKTVERGTIIEEDIANVKNTVLLKETIDKMYSMCIIGWTQEGEKIRHVETGVEVNPKVWHVKDNMLVDREGKHPDIDFDWAYKAREAVKEYISNKNVNIVEDILKNYGRQIRG